MVQEPKSLQDAIIYFSNQDNCIEYLASRRWPDGVICPMCGSTKVSAFNPTRRTWKCGSHHPRREFSVKVGTIFEDSPISLDKWLMATWLLVNCKNGISSYELAKDAGVTQKSAWFVLHRIRLALAGGSFEKMGGEDGGPVEVDETYIGGNPMNRHKNKRTKKWLTDEEGKEFKNPLFGATAGRATEKTPVFGMLDRETRKVRAHALDKVRRDVLMNAILANVERGSTIYSDGLKDYQGLDKMEFVHEAVNHVNEYVRGEVHTQGIENFWSLLKRGLRGTYVAVEPFHLDRYVGEQIFRFNNRATKDNPLTDSDRFALAVRQIAGKRLTFAELTGKAPN
jgi:transposase-like protein